MFEVAVVMDKDPTEPAAAAPPILLLYRLDAVDEPGSGEVAEDGPWRAGPSFELWPGEAERYAGSD